jgi:hypothetical protein
LGAILCAKAAEALFASRAGEMTDAPTPTCRKSSIIVGRNATSNEKQGDKPIIPGPLHLAWRYDMMDAVNDNGA